jgi:hypothetical protein
VKWVIQALSCANVIITNDHCLQSPVEVPCCNYRLEIHRAFNVMREAIDSCTSIPLDTLLARLVTADTGTGMIEHDPVLSREL